MDTKPTNPKDALGSSKTPLWVLPFRVLRGVGMALFEGALKYGAYNWRDAGVRATIYYDAAINHLGDWWEGEDIDSDSGLSHIDKAIASLVVMRDSMYHGNFVDDRPIKATGEYPMRTDPRVAELIDRYPDPVPAHTEARRGELDDPMRDIDLRMGYVGAHVDSSGTITLLAGCPSHTAPSEDEVCENCGEGWKW